MGFLLNEDLTVIHDAISFRSNCFHKHGKIITSIVIKISPSLKLKLLTGNIAMVRVLSWKISHLL